MNLQFVKGNASDACVALSGTVSIRVDVTCHNGYAGCPISGRSTILNVTLDTGDACPVSEQVQFSAADLAGN
jgi:hypothetical protein